MADDDSTTTTKGKTNTVTYCRDHATDDYYGGKVSPELVQAVKDNDGKPVYAVLKSVFIDNYGNKDNVWFPAPELDMPGARPGEHRKVYLHDQQEAAS